MKNHRLFTSYTVYSRHFVFLLCVIFILTIGWFFTAVDAQGRNKSLTIFPKAFYLILDNYIDEPGTAPLIFGAIKGMEKMLTSKNITFTKPDLNLENIEGDKDKSLKIFFSTFKKFLALPSVQSRELEYAGINGMLKMLDPHSTFITPEMYKEMQVETKGEFAGVGIQISIKDGVLTVLTPIDGTPAYNAGIKAGDKIVMINNVPTEGITLIAAVKKIRGPRGTKVTLSIMRDDFTKPRHFKIIRDIVKVKSVKYRFLEDDIGYIRISMFSKKTSDDVEEALYNLGSRDGLKGLVVDLRNNPGGLLTQSVKITDKFIDSELITYLEGRTISNKKFRGKTFGTHPFYALIVLVNRGTASGAEILAGAVQDINRAVILGEQTFGKGTVQTIYSLADGSGLRLTTGKYYLPSGRVIQGNGITPDIEVEKEGKDDDYLISLAQSILKRGNGAISNKELKKIALSVFQEKGNEIAKLLSEKKPSLSSVHKSSIKSDVDILPLVNARTKNNAYAIVIGIEKYREKLPSVDFAESDANLVTDYLTGAMGFPEENVVTLLNDRATRSDIKKYIETWLSNNVEKDGSVFIYYSGHGAPNPKTGDAYLVPYDGDPTFIKDTGYPLSRLYESLEKLPAKEVVVMLDSCFSGAGGRSVIAKGARPLVVTMAAPEDIGGKTVVLAASSGSQISSTYEEKGHGLFTYFMLKGLKGKADIDEDGRVEINELLNYVKPNVERIARKFYNNEQTPQLIMPEGQRVFLIEGVKGR